MAGGGGTKLRTDTFSVSDTTDRLRAGMELNSPGLFPEAYADTTRRALDSADALGDALATARATYDTDRHFGGAGGKLEGQLRMVARMIAAGRDQLGLRRQVFFVSMGLFDDHSQLAERHPGQLRAIDNALADFYNATVELGAVDQVATFTASDFGRTIHSNGNGTDHGWGGHHMVMGGSVIGNRVYGDVPVIARTGPDDTGRGVLIPRQSVDQYAATFATWMGAGANELEAVVPNIGNYDVKDLGFLRSGDLRPVHGAGGNEGLRTATRMGTARG